MTGMGSSALRLSFALLALHGTVQGAATYSQMTTAANRTAINEYNSFMAKAMAALAKLAYCGVGPRPFIPYGTENGLKGSASKSCGGLCKKAGFSLGKIELVSATDNGQKNADFAYVAKLNPAGGKTPPADCALAFRGTWVSPANTDRNSQTELVDWPMPSCKNKGCKVHSGANAIWGEIKGGIIDSLKGMQCTSLTVTGHSLGGQLAALAMFSLQDQYGFKVELSYTFEGSTPFNSAATTVFDSGLWDRPISLFRITHTSDRIPLFPQKPDYLQPGSQVWFYGPGALDYVHCGTLAQAPKCGVNGLPSDVLCSMNKNPSWKKCGGTAPSGGPHCTHPVAPAGNFCNMAGSSTSNFVGASTQTCAIGGGLYTKAMQPTVPPQVFPVTMPTQEPTTTLIGQAAGTTTVNDFAGGPAFNAKMPSCWTMDTAYAPLGMLSLFVVKKSTPQSCQAFCASTPYCEYVSYWSLDGSCHVSGGWAQQISTLGAMSGPKDCALPLPTETDIYRRVNMEAVYLRSLTGGDPANPFVRFNERGLWHSAVPGNLSVGSFVAFGISMMVVGASATLLLTRAVSLRRIGSRQATRALMSSTHFIGEEVDGLE